MLWVIASNALLQQTLWTKAQAIAQTYPADARSSYTAAALTLRLPYWDWGIQQELPLAAQEVSITINTPNGQQTVENPLYDYKFQGDAEANGFPRDLVGLADVPFTVRQMDLNTHQSNQSTVNALLLANAGQIISGTYNLFSEITDYATFSCIAPNGQTNIGNNIELLHGNIHNIVGGDGHMTWPEVSAFDPIFWLHHANVDRLFAMWQVLNPNSYFGPSGALNIFGSFYEPPGSIDSGNSSLAPFHVDNGTRLFTNDDVRPIARFNYAYPDIPDWYLNGTQLANYVRTEINAMYNAPVQQRRRSVALERPISILNAFSNIGLDEIKAFGVNNAEFQWKINVVLDRYAYRTAFSLHFFMGLPPDDIRMWSAAPNLVGTESQFIAANVSAMFPASRPSASSRGEMPLTHTLLAGVNRGLLRDLSPRTVVPVLQDVLTWRATTPDGSEVDLTQLSGLSISVGSRKTIPTTNMNQFPTYGPIIWHPEATVGKVGGVGIRRISPIPSG